MTFSCAILLATLSQTGLPPELEPKPIPVPQAPEAKPKEPASVATRALLGTGGGALAGTASLGIAVLLVGRNDNFDPNFATAALASILITGVTFAIHEALGGRGEITLALLFTTIVMATTGAIVGATTTDRMLAPVLTAAIGSVPAAAAAVFGLEATSPKPKARVAIAFGPTGFSGRF